MYKESDFERTLRAIREREQKEKDKQRYLDEYSGVWEDKLKVKDSDLIRQHIDFALDNKDEEQFNILVSQWKGALYREKARKEHLRKKSHKFHA